MSTRIPFLRRFILIGGMIIILLAGVLILNHALSEKVGDQYTKLSLIARQRSFAEELSKELITSKLGSFEDPDLETQRSITLQKWENAQRAIEYGDPAYSIEANHSRKSRELVKRLGQAHAELKASFAFSEVLTEEDLINLKGALETYRQAAAELQYQFDQEAGQSLKMLKRLQIGASLAIVLILILAFRFLVRPALVQLRDRNLELDKMNENLEVAIQSRSRFLANLSHELQTPLQGILGVAGLLRKQETDVRKLESLDILQKSADRLTGMISGILDHSMLESGLLSLNKEEFDLHRCLKEVCDMYRPVCHEKGIELQMNIASDLPNLVIQDALRLRQVLMSLLSNAVRFTDSGEVELRSEMLHTQSNFVQIRFSVRDTGKGLPDHIKKQISNGDPSIAKGQDASADGLGLGLSLSRELVRKMNGYMRAESKQGLGSEVSFTIVAEVHSENGESLPDMSVLENRKAIVVDNNTNSLRIMVRTLASWGMQATPFNNPELVSEVMENLGRYDVCLLDLQMPGTDGLALATSIREHHGKEVLPIILLSDGVTGTTVVNDGLVDAVLTKPVRPDQLLIALRRVFRNEAGGRAQSPGFVQSGPRGLKILIAEDNPLHLAVAERNLHVLGHRTEPAGSSTELFERLRKDKYDLLMIDGKLCSAEEWKTFKELIGKDEEKPVIFEIAEGQGGSHKHVPNAEEEISDLDTETLAKRINHWFSEE